MLRQVFCEAAFLRSGAIAELHRAGFMANLRWRFKMSRHDKTVSALKWGARLASIGTFLFIGMFLVGELTGGDGQAPRSDEWLGVLFFPVGLLAGLALGWRKEMAGGLMSLLSIAAFYGWNFSRTGSWPSGPWFLILATPAVAFVLAAALKNPDRRPDNRSGLRDRNTPEALA